jgi:hypothetical protein
LPATVVENAGISKPALPRQPALKGAPLAADGTNKSPVNSRRKQLDSVFKGEECRQVWRRIWIIFNPNFMEITQHIG